MTSIKNQNSHYQKIVTSPHKTEYVRTMFAKIAPRYDSMNHIMSLGRDLAWRRKAIKKAAFNTGDRILDLGVGTGDFSRELIRQVKNKFVVGLDNCADLIAKGRQKPALKDIRWLLGNGQQLPFVSNSFDGVIAAFSVRNMANLAQVFSEISRILKPRGKFVILDMVKPQRLLSYKIFSFHFKYIVPKLGHWFGSDPEAYSYLFPSIDNFYTSVQLKHVLQDHGFAHIISHDLMLGTVALCIGVKSDISNYFKKYFDG